MPGTRARLLAPGSAQLSHGCRVRHRPARGAQLRSGLIMAGRSDRCKIIDVHGGTSGTTT